jgi:hypothetical protein
MWADLVINSLADVCAPAGEFIGQGSSQNLAQPAAIINVPVAKPPA